MFWVSIVVVVFFVFGFVLNGIPKISDNQKSRYTILSHYNHLSQNAVVCCVLNEKVQMSEVCEIKG